MARDDLLERLRGRAPDEDVAARFAQFNAETGSDDEDLFLAWLRARGALTLSDFVEVHVSAPIRTNADVHVDPMTAPVQRLEAGYTTLGLVGEGAMASVHLARDERLGRKVAMKVLPGTRNGSAQRRFVNEAQIMAQLEHPHIVPVHALEVGHDGGLAYTMKLVRGQMLSQVIEDDRASVRERGRRAEDRALHARLEHFVKICDAMAYAHDKGVIHRDLKPANIMIGSHNEVYVVDWGIAKVIDDDAGGIGVDATTKKDDLAALSETLLDDRTQVGTLVGTPRYMAPEQLAGDALNMDRRGDVAALGVVLYELVTLRVPRPCDTLHELRALVFAGDLGPLDHAVANIPIARELVAIIRKATAVDPTARYPTAAALGEDVRRFLRNEGVEAAPDSALQRLQRWMSRHKQITFSLVAGLLLILAGVLIAGLYRRQVALESAGRREAKLEAFLTRAGRQAARIDNGFLEVEVRVARFATAARALLEHGRDTSDPIYLADDLDDPALPHPPLAPSRRYRGHVTLAWMDFSIPPDRALEQLAPTFRRLSPLRFTLRDVLLSSRALSPTTAHLSDDEAESHARDHGLPIDRAYFGSVEGWNAEMPGQYWDTTGYDPRLRPWYRLADRQRGTHWGNPFVEIATESLLISCSSGVWSSRGEFLGVAGVGMAVRYVVDDLLSMADEPAVIAAHLVNEEGLVVVASADAHRDVKLGPLDRREELVPYRHREALNAIGGSGTHHTTDGDQTLLLVAFPLASTGWRYVVEVDREALLR